MGAIYATQRTEERLALADAARHAIAQRLAVAESDARDAAAATAQARANGRHAEQRGSSCSTLLCICHLGSVMKRHDEMIEVNQAY